MSEDKDWAAAYDKAVQNHYPQNDGRARAIELIRQGLDCLEGKHELKSCFLGHFGILACIHCGYILPEEYCECGHPNKDECFEARYLEDGSRSGMMHLGIDKNAGGVLDPDYTKVMGKDGGT